MFLILNAEQNWVIEIAVYTVMNDTAERRYNAVQYNMICMRTVKATSFWITILHFLLLLLGQKHH